MVSQIGSPLSMALATTAYEYPHVLMTELRVVGTFASSGVAGGHGRSRIETEYWILSFFTGGTGGFLEAAFSDASDSDESVKIASVAAVVRMFFISVTSSKQDDLFQHDWELGNGNCRALEGAESDPAQSLDETALKQLVLKR